MTHKNVATRTEHQLLSLMRSWILGLQHSSIVEHPLNSDAVTYTYNNKILIIINHHITIVVIIIIMVQESALGLW